MVIVTIVRPPSISDWWLRIYVANTQSWTTLKPSRLRVSVPATGHAVFWLGTNEDTTTLPAKQTPWKTKCSFGYCLAPLVARTRKLSFVDPSVRDANQIYQEVDSAEVEITGDGALIPVAPLDMRHLFKLGAAEMDDYENVKRNLQSDYNPIMPAAMGQFLNRFTTVRGQLPAATFMAVGADDKPMDPAVLLQLLGFACNMHGIDLREWLRSARAFVNDPHANAAADILDIIAEAVVFSAVCCVYVNDHARKKDVERFQIGAAQRLGQGDCDDVAKEATYWVWCGIQRMQLADRDPLAPVLAIIREFVPAMFTGLATSASLKVRDATEAGGDIKDYICHLWAMMIAREHMAVWTGEEERYKSKNSALAHVLASLGSITCEGTNFTAALHRPLTVYWPADEAQRRAKAKAWRKGIRHAIEKRWPVMADLDFRSEPTPTLREPRTYEEQSGFYRIALTMWVPPDPNDDTAPFAYHLVQGDTFGASFKDIVDGSLDISTVPCYTRRLSNAELQAALSAQPPRKPFNPEKMKLHLRNGPGSTRLNEPFIEYRVQHPNQVTPAIHDALSEMSKHGTFAVSRLGLAKHIHGITQYKFYPNEALVREASPFIAELERRFGTV